MQIVKVQMLTSTKP